MAVAFKAFVTFLIILVLVMILMGSRGLNTRESRTGAIVVLFIHVLSMIAIWL